MAGCGGEAVAGLAFTARISDAEQRADGNLLPLPGSLRGGAAAKVVGTFLARVLARGLAREQVTHGTTRADTARRRRARPATTPSRRS